MTVSHVSWEEKQGHTSGQVASWEVVCSGGRGFSALGLSEGLLGQPSQREARTPPGGKRSQAEHTRPQNRSGRSHTGFVTDSGLLVPVAGGPGGSPWNMNFLILESSVVMA